MYRLSLYQRLQISFILFILLPITIVSVTSYMETKQNMLDKIEATNQNLIRVIAYDLEKTVDDIAYSSVFFTGRNDELGLLGSFKALKDVTGFTSYSEYEHAAKLRGLSNILLVQSADVNLSMMIINRKRFMIFGNEEQAGEQAALAELEASARLDMNNRHVLQWFRHDTYYYAARIIEDPEKHEVLAVLYIGIPQSYFQRLFQTAGSGNLYLLDERGEVIASLSDEAFSRKDDAVIRLQQSIPKTGWRLVYDVPHEQVTGQISQGFFRSLTVIITSAVVFLIFSVFLARGLNKPIHKLKNIAEQYGRGNRFVRFKTRGSDEIAVLGKSFNQMLDDINQLFHQIELEQEEKRTLELQALFSQIRPHFLLNTLNSIKCNLMLEGDEKNGDMIQSLMNLLRGYIRVHEPASLEEELKLIKDYVLIMQMRNQMVIDLTMEMEDELKTFRIPRLLIQPIVENAILHGFRKQRDHAHIELTVRVKQGAVVISATDNGKGLTEEELTRLSDRLAAPDSELSSAGHGIGLVNVLRRLKLTYGSQARMEVAANPAGQGVLCSLIIPIWNKDSTEGR